MRRVRVAIVDEQPVVRAGVVGVLARDADIEIVAETSTVKELIVRGRGQRIDVVLMDVGAVASSSARACLDVLESAPGIRVVALRSPRDLESVLAILRAGARGYLVKDLAGSELREAVRKAARGEVVLSPAILERIIDVALHAPFGPGQRPTDDELAVLALLADGLSTGEIAERLHIAPGTVKTRLRRSVTKLRARDRGQAVAVALRAGLFA